MLNVYYTCDLAKSTVNYFCRLANGVHIGLSSKGGTFSAQGTPERFGMIGMDVRLCNGTSGLRMFPPGTLIFGALSPFFMRL